MAFGSLTILVLFSSLLLALSSPSWGQGALFAVKGEEKKIINEYLGFHNKYFKKACGKHRAEHKYYKLYKTYRGAGYFVPILSDNILDIETIQKFLPLFDEKLAFIKIQQKFVKKKFKVKAIKTSIKELEYLMNKLLEDKERIYRLKESRKRTLVLLESRKKYNKLKKEFDHLLKLVPFILSFKFPVDHFELRKQYDEFQEREGPKFKKLSNDVYFLRRIVQDGAQNPNHSRSDKFLRSVIDTVYLTLNTQRNTLTENLRYDISTVINGIQKQVKRGSRGLQKRLAEWLERTQETKKYYQSLIKEKNGLVSMSEKAIKLLKEKSISRYELKKYTTQKQIESYKFWSQKKEVIKMLYAMETILFNEVGSVDGPSALERRDVAQVVLNRKNVPKYRYLDDNDFLYTPLLKHFSINQLKREHWLNILFKTGEFSFTYFFIPASVKVYCPDRTRLGKRLRRNNLKLILDLVQAPMNTFKALRYFSRASMLGRIDMTDLWDDYVPLPERVGLRVKRPSGLKSMHQKGLYTFLYSFMDPLGREFQVLKMKKKVYSLLVVGKEQIYYHHRNPHLFKYFTPMLVTQR